MKIEVWQVDLLQIDRHDANAILGELNSLNVVMDHKKYPKLNEIRKLLSANFTSSKAGVHWISNEVE